MNRWAVCLAVLGLALVSGAAAWAAGHAPPTKSKSIAPKTGYYEETADNGQEHIISAVLKVVRLHGESAVEVTELIAKNGHACNFAGGFRWIDEASLKKPIPVVNGKFSSKSTSHLSRGIRTPVTIKGQVTGTIKSATKVVGQWSAVLNGDEPDPASGITFHCDTGPETFSAKWVPTREP